MTRRLTISVPDDVAERIDKEPNASAFIAELIRRSSRFDSLRTYLRDELGVTEEGKSRARARILGARIKANDPDRVAQREAFWAEVDASSDEHVK